MNKPMKIAIVAGLVAAVAVIIAKQSCSDPEGTTPQGDAGVVGQQVVANSPGQLTGQGRPALVDLGAKTCIPCKMMAPILEDLKTEYSGIMDVHFLDVRENPNLGALYSIRVMPTQIFYDPSGKELFRHEGFFSKEDILAKWQEFGIDLSSSPSQTPTFERFTPAKADDRPKESVCYMCDGDIKDRTLVTVETDKGPVRLCSPHCYFIMYSCLTEDKTGFEEKVSVTDWASGNPVPATAAVFLYGQEENTGRPWTRAFADRESARTERASNGGNLLTLDVLQKRELSHRCGFCERACYPEDAAEVIAAGVHTWGCCSHCALGVAARTGQDIEVHERDRLTSKPIVVKTLAGTVASLEPKTAVAWFGQRQKADGTWGSAGCFHQGFFANADNLQKWVENNPYETGKLISIHQALANKMKLSPAQIQKACKIGECSPK